MTIKNYIKLRRKKVVILFLCFIMAGGFLSALFFNPIPTFANTFNIGDMVSVTAKNLRVRQLPTANSKILGSQSLRAKGTIVSGPKTANGYTWWQINYEKGVDGWSADKYLTVIKPTVLGIFKNFIPTSNKAKVVTNKLKTNDRVYVSGQYAAVGAQPSIKSAKAASQPKNALGTILAGPKSGDGLNWWQINYDSGADGWSVEKYLSSYIATTTKSTATTTITGATSGSGSSSGSVSSATSGSGSSAGSGSGAATNPPPATPPVTPPATPPTPPVASSTNPVSTYPLHQNITAAVFWVGEPQGGGSSEDNALSAWDDAWQSHYGGFDDPQNRNGYYPAGFTPKENPFYLDLPYNDYNDNGTRKTNASQVVPWANEKNWGKNESMMKNRWVKLTRNGAVCYGQIEDAGPYQYDDYAYVFGASSPKSKEANNAGLDVSPALRDCLKFSGWNNVDNKVDWQFVSASEVPAGPWKEIITTTQIYWP